MDARHFHDLIKNFSQLNEQELREVQSLSKAYPYSQVIHALEARVARDQHHPDEEKVLHESAVYATDRTVLKWVMTSPRGERIFTDTKPEPAAEELKVGLSESADVEIIAAPHPAKEIIEPEQAAPIPTPGNSLSGDALREDLLFELTRLQELKHNFEESIDAYQKTHPSDTPGEQHTKRRKPKAIEPAGEALLEEIKSTKKKISAESPKQKEQNEIIEQFIKEKPSLPKARPGEPAKDLSEDSSAFSDNIISETLVGILLKQGKKEKAIEVLKKLIWKFPQKKAYFAAQIEELKN